MILSLRRLPLAIFIVLLVLPDFAAAWPRRRMSRTSQTQRYTSGGQVRVAQKVDGDSASYRALGVTYDYDLGGDQKVAFADRIRIFLRVRDRAVIEAETPVVAEAKVTDLSNVQGTQVHIVPVSLEDEPGSDDKIATFDVVNQDGQPPLVRSGRVYRIFVNLHAKAPQYDAQSVLGKVTTPYYVATSGPTRIERARRHVVMRAFKEFYYTEKGWRSGESYSMDCVAFYRWAAGSCTVGANSGHANLGRLFGILTPFRNGSAVSTLAKEDGIHGDYVRIPGHSFMLLAHDPNLQQTWTLEGNFNHSIEIAIRSASSGWTVGHLADAHIRSDLFQLSDTPQSDRPRNVSVEMDDSPAF